MMEYLKRRFSSNETSLMTDVLLTDEQVVVVENEVEVFSEEKTKVLLIIDTQEIDW